MTEIVRWLRRPRPVLSRRARSAQRRQRRAAAGPGGVRDPAGLRVRLATTEVAPLYLGVSVLDAARRGLRGDFSGSRGRLALGLTGVAWALLGVIVPRRAVRLPHWIALCARHWRRLRRGGRGR